MKIATWNIERFQSRFQKQILETIQEIDADILVLTETFSSIELNGYEYIKTSSLPKYIDGQDYREGENRSSIYSKYPIVNSHETYNNYTSICADINTPLGIITVYASIIGIVGNRQPYFNNDLDGQLQDFDRIFPSKENICIMGDLNTTFTGRVFPSHHARNTLNDAFDKFNLQITTKDIDNNVDHIIISKHFLNSNISQPFIFNVKQPKLSDHIGVCLEI